VSVKYQTLDLLIQIEKCFTFMLALAS